MARMGRPPRSTEERLLQEIDLHFPPELIIEKLNTALALAEKQNSTRSILKCLEFIVSYTVGEPVKRIQHSQSGYDQLKDLIVVASEQIEERRRIEQVSDNP